MNLGLGCIKLSILFIYFAFTDVNALITQKTKQPPNYLSQADQDLA